MRIRSLDLQYLPAVVEVPVGIFLQLLHLLHFVQHLMYVKFGHEELQTTVSVRLSKKVQSNTLVTFTETTTFIIIQYNFNNSRATLIIVILSLYCIIYYTVDYQPLTSNIRFLVFLFYCVLQT